MELSHPIPEYIDAWVAVVKLSQKKAANYRLKITTNIVQHKDILYGG